MLTLAALEEFADLIAKYPVQKRFLVATQAVRTAENKAEFVKAVYEKLGWDVEIISGEREAWLSYLGATFNLEEENPLVVDIGGGSTEFMFKAADGQIAVRSISLGALRLLGNPLTDEELDNFLQEALLGFCPANTAINLIGVGGTCTTLAAVCLKLAPYDPEKVQGHKVSSALAREVYERLAGMPVKERLQVRGMFPGREDIIVPGLQILQAVLRYFGSRALTVSDRDLLYGLIYEELLKQG